MYGSVAHMRLKPGQRDAMIAELRVQEREWDHMPGAVAVYWYCVDGDDDGLIMVAVFDTREAYRANANSPEQDQRYLRLRKYMAEDPVWYDGEVETYLRF
jgi:hypothetical protein